MMYLTVIAVVSLCVAGTVAGVAVGCVADKKGATLAAFGNLTGLQTIYNNTAANIPAVLTTLCNSSEAYLGAATTIQDNLAACQALAADAAVITAMGQVQIAEKSFTNFITEFPSVAGFCVCAPSLDAAWAMKKVIDDGSVSLTSAVDQGSYDHVADIATICGNPTVKANMQSLYTGTGTTCTQLKDQSGMPITMTPAAFKEQMKLATMCTGYVAAKWTCAVDESKEAVFKTCVNAAQGMTSDIAQCSARDCVIDNIAPDDKCGDDIVNLFIAAVNAHQTTVSKKIKTTDCDAASSVQISLMVALVALAAHYF